MGDVFTLLLVGGFAFQVVALVVLLSQFPSGAALQLVLAVAAYLVHGAIGIAVLIYCRPFLSDTSTAALGAVAALFGWLALGLHGLFRLIPVTTDKSKPRWMTQLGIYDVACLLVIGGGIAAALL
jgi:hypothetical protein